MNRKLFIYPAELERKCFCFGANKSKKVSNVGPLFFTVSDGNQHSISKG